MSAHLLVPHTGELVNLEAEPRVLAEALNDMREMEAQIRSAKGVLSREIHRRMDASARWTLEAGPWQLVGASPGRLNWDADQLAEIVLELVEEGTINAAAAEAAVEQVHEWRARPVGVNALRKLGPEIAARVEQAAEPVNNDLRRVSLKRA
jgi:polyhydroxyalkanoate synthesis regulator phasin